MEAHFKKLLPQEGTAASGSGESFTEPSSVCPTYSGGDKNCSSLDLSGLAEAIPRDTNTTSQWSNVAAHKRPSKRSSRVQQENTKGQKGLPECSRHNRRTGREAPKPQPLPHPKSAPTETVTAATKTRREPDQSDPKAPATAPEGTESQNPPPPSKAQPAATSGATASTPSTSAPRQGTSGGDLNSSSQSGGHTSDEDVLLSP